MSEQEIKVVLKPEDRLRKLEKAGTNFKLDKHIPVRRYFKSGAEMLRMANNYYEDDNLQKAYILYHKYLSLFIEKITKHPEYPSVNSQDKIKVKRNLMIVLKKCEDIKSVLKLGFKEEYSEYLDRLEVERQEEEEIARRLEEQRIQDEHDRLRAETENYHKAKESSLLEARDKELALWHKCQQDEARVLEEMKRKLDSSSPPPTQPTAPPAPAVDRTAKPAVPDRSTKPFSFTFDDELTPDHGGLRTLCVPGTLMPSFLSVAEPNTTVNVETCGLLAGRMVKNSLRITHLVIPKQSGTSDSCTTEGEEDQIACLDEHNLITLGWIHTHPSQTAFLSSVDLHTHASYQLMLPESVAIVCAPKYNETGFFVLTPNYGLDYIANCRLSGFHPHPKEPPLFEEGSHIQLDRNANVTVIDLR